MLYADVSFDEKSYYSLTGNTRTNLFQILDQTSHVQLDARFGLINNVNGNPSRSLLCEARMIVCAARRSAAKSSNSKSW